MESESVQILDPGLKGMVLDIGKGRVLREGTDVVLLGYGTPTNNCFLAAQLLQDFGVSATVADARFCKPLDVELIRRLAKSHPVFITVEEGSIGGFSSHVLHFLATDGLLDGGLKVRPMVLPDRPIDHGSYSFQLNEAGLSASHIASTALSLVGKQHESLEVLALSLIHI